MTSAFATSFSAFVISLLFAATLIIVRREYALRPHVTLWALSFGLLALSHGCRMIVHDAPASGAAAAYLARGFLVASVVSLAAGFRQRMDKRLRGICGFGATALIVLAVCWGLHSASSLAIARVVGAMAVAGMLWAIFRSMRGRGGTTVIARVIALLYASYMVLLAIAAWIAWNGGGVTDNAFATMTLVGMPVVTVGAGILVLLVLVSDLAGALRDQSLRDPLTKALNRRGLEEQMRKVRRSTAPISIIAADLDRFKQINDELGHAAGDRVLIAFAEHLRSAAPNAIIARTGGEEFVLIELSMPESEAARHAASICLGVTLSAARAHGISGITASFGVASGFASDDWTVLAAQADRALYAAKHAGRNRAVVFRHDMETGRGQSKAS